ncbi:MAG: hypothetical protein ACKOWF_01690, partial [Chloroflexota bacterium]
GEGLLVEGSGGEQRGVEGLRRVEIGGDQALRGHPVGVLGPAPGRLRAEGNAAASPDLDRDVETEGIALVIPTWTAGGVPFGTQTAGRWTEYADWMASQGLIPADLDPAKAFDSSLLPA